MPRPKFSPMEGTEVLVTIQFTDDLGEPATPLAPEAYAQRLSPSADEPIMLVLTEIGGGIYEGRVFVNSPGDWVVQARGEGEGTRVTEEVNFTVRPRSIPYAVLLDELPVEDDEEPEGEVIPLFP